MHMNLKSLGIVTSQQIDDIAGLTRCGELPVHLDQVIALKNEVIFACLGAEHSDDLRRHRNQILYAKERDLVADMPSVALHQLGCDQRWRADSF